MAEQRKKAAKAAKIAKDKMACNKPQKTPGHPTKSHVVKACEGSEEKIIRFGQQGVEGAGKNPTTAKEKHARNRTTPVITLRIRIQTRCQHVTGPTKLSGDSLLW
jgi:hypothetical protein